MDKSGIAIAGTILVDLIKEIDAYPALSELTKINSVKRAIGGCVPNVGIDLKRMMPDLPIYALGMLGKDENGKYSLGILKEAGLDTRGMKESDSVLTSYTDVMSIVGGQRTFFTYPGASNEFGYDDIDWDTLDARMLHLGYFLLLDKIDAGDGLRILKEAKKRGISTSIDLVTEKSDRYNVVLPCLPYTDNLIVNELEAGKLAGISPEKENLPKIAETLHNLGVRERVIIHMPDVAVCYHDGKCITLPSFDLPEGYIKGSVGAGDAFCAGALLGIYEGLSDMEILELASAAAVCSLSEADATSGLCCVSAIQERCKNFKRKAE